MTATVTIRDADAQEGGGWLGERLASLADHLRDIARSQPQPDGNENGVTVTLPTPKSSGSEAPGVAANRS